MSTFLLRLLPVLLLMASSLGAETTNRLHFASSGFSIAPLEAPRGQVTQQVLMMFLPTVGEFTPNVNVQVQPYDGSLEDYVKLSLKQFESANLKMVQQGRTKDSGAVFEYRGEIQNRRLHWYAKAQKSEGRVYLVTATALEEHWAEVASNLKDCVDSFTCDSVAAAPATKSATRP
jgi:PsbP